MDFFGTQCRTSYRYTDWAWGTCYVKTTHQSLMFLFESLPITNICEMSSKAPLRDGEQRKRYTFTTESGYVQQRYISNKIKQNVIPKTAKLLQGAQSRQLQSSPTFFLATRWNDRLFFTSAAENSLFYICKLNFISIHKFTALSPTTKVLTWTHTLTTPWPYSHSPTLSQSAGKQSPCNYLQHSGTKTT